MISWSRTLLLSSAIAGLIALAGGAPILRYELEQIRIERANRPNPRPATEAQQRDIIRALLREQHYSGLPPPPPEPGEPWQLPKPKPVVLASTSVVFCRDVREPDWACIHSHVEETLGATFLETKIPLKFRLELVAGNRTSTPIPDPHVDQALHRPLAEVERALAGSDWWHGFYRAFPGTAGLLQVSRAVLSEDGRHALIYVAHSCDGLCGTGAVLELIHDGNGWRIEDGIPLWVS
jgi:hypothetical protein